MFLLVLLFCNAWLLTQFVRWYVKMFDVFLLFMLAITDLAYVVSKCLKSQCDIFHSN